MSRTELVQDLAKLNVRLSLDGGQLSVDAPAGTMTPDLVERIKIHKPALIEALTRRSLRRIRSWLEHIKEPDQHVIEGILSRCKADPETMRYYLERARETPDAARQKRLDEADLLLAMDRAQRYVYVIDNADTDPVIVTIAIRGVGSFDMEVPQDKWDSMMFLQFLEGEMQ